MISARFIFNLSKIFLMNLIHHRSLLKTMLHLYTKNKKRVITIMLHPFLYFGIETQNNIINTHLRPLYDLEDLLARSWFGFIGTWKHRLGTIVFVFMGFELWYIDYMWWIWDEMYLIGESEFGSVWWERLGSEKRRIFFIKCVLGLWHTTLI